MHRHTATHYRSHTHTEMSSVLARPMIAAPVQDGPGPGAFELEPGSYNRSISDARLMKVKTWLAQEMIAIREAGGALDHKLLELARCMDFVYQCRRTQAMRDDGEQLNESLLKWRIPCIKEDVYFVHCLGRGSREWRVICDSGLVIPFVAREMYKLQMVPGKLTEFEADMLTESIQQVRDLLESCVLTPRILEQVEGERDQTVSIYADHDTPARYKQLCTILVRNCDAVLMSTRLVDVISIPAFKGTMRLLMLELSATERKKALRIVATMANPNNDVFYMHRQMRAFDIILCNQENHWRPAAVGDILHHAHDMPRELVGVIAAYTSHRAVFEVGSGIEAAEAEVALARARHQIEAGDTSTSLKRHADDIEREIENRNSDERKKPKTIRF